MSAPSAVTAKIVSIVEANNSLTRSRYILTGGLTRQMATEASGSFSVTPVQTVEVASGGRDGDRLRQIEITYEVAIVRLIQAHDQVAGQTTLETETESLWKTLDDRDTNFGTTGVRCRVVGRRIESVADNRALRCVMTVSCRTEWDLSA